MKAPDKIYVNDYGIWYKKKPPVKVTEEYIRKNALLGWAKEMKFYATDDGARAYENIVDKINSL